jgi:uncharacterized protein (TIGR02266 family)
MQQDGKRRILTVGLTVEEYARIALVFDEGVFEVDRFPGAKGALDLIRDVRVEVLLVRYPLPDMVLPPFLQTVRHGPCRRSPVLLLADGDRCQEAQRYVGRGANRVLSLDSSPGALHSTLSSLLDVAPRKSRHFIAQLKFESGDGEDWILCRSENSSASGVLLATDRQLPRGTRVHFELTLPTVERPVKGEAEIARLTVVGRERVRGMGLRFLSFAGDSREIYEDFLRDRG